MSESTHMTANGFETCRQPEKRPDIIEQRRTDITELSLPISLLLLCFFKKQGYVLVKDANIPQSQDLPQNVTPQPPEGWGDKNDDTLRNVKTLTRSESIKPPSQPDGNELELQPALDGQIGHPDATMNEGKPDKEIPEMKDDDEKAIQKMN